MNPDATGSWNDIGADRRDIYLIEWPSAVLSWLGTTGFLADGVDPNRGLAYDTIFAFKVKLTTPDGGLPDAVRLVIERDGQVWRTFDMRPRSGSALVGKVYYRKTKLPPGNYRYRFGAQYEGSPAEGVPTQWHDGPKMPSPPYLSWVRGSGYRVRDAVEPNRGDSNTDYTLKVLYRDLEGNLPTYVRVQLWRNGADYGTFAMQPPPPPLDPSEGLVYSLTRQFDEGNYEYEFQAADRHGRGAGPASERLSGLEVVPATPVLSWTGAAGFTTDGVDPDAGDPDDVYDFRVNLRDPDGDEPDWVRLRLLRDGALYDTVDLAALSGDPTVTGRDYGAQMALPAGNYVYRFAARDEDGLAQEGEPTQTWIGPIMPAPAFLRYHHGTGYANDDGVEPNAGQADATRFVFRCIYRSHDGDAPAWVLVRLWRDGAFYRSFRMGARGSTYDPVAAGITYGAARRLPAGNYEYAFAGQDWRGEACGGPATQRLANLAVTGGAATLTALSAVPTAGGAQITFTLGASAQVRAEVMNVAGRRICVLARDQHLDAGRNTLLWNGRTSSGRPVASGMYIVDVRARGDDGTEVRALRPLTVERR